MAVVTVTRRLGAGGMTLGSRVAKELGYRFIDDVVIEELARRVRVTHEAVRDIENIAGGFFSKVISAMLNRNYMERLTGEDFGYIDEVVYLKTLKEVIQDLARNDNVILLGRCAECILEDHPKALHIHLVAEEKDRIEFLQKTYGLTLGKAKKAVEDGEKRRRKLYSLFGRSNYDDPLAYHIVINTSRVSKDQAMEQMLTLVRQFDER